MIKHLFNHLGCSIIQEKAEVNAPGETFCQTGEKYFQTGETREEPMSNMGLPHHHGEGKEAAWVQEQIGHVDDFQTVAEVFRQLGDPTRVRIFWLLCHCEECVINISAMLEMSSPAVSHHLRPLKNSGLIVSRREGKEVYYRAADTTESRLLHQMIEEVMKLTCQGVV